MQFTIPRRWYSSLPQITVEIGAQYEQSSNAVRLGAAVKVVIEQAKKTDTRAILTRADLTDAILRGAILTDADLTHADLTHAVLRGAILRGAILTDAILRGAILTDADLTHAVLRGAILRGAILTDAVLTRADLTDAVLTRADLTDAILRGAILTDAVLTHAILRGAILTDADLTHADLTRADLRGAVLTRADIPIIPNIDAAILKAIEDGGELQMGKWHTCKTTHCRAGWAITLAGERGKNLEDVFGPAAAGALIYAASRPDTPVPNFYASDEAAMADIKACAAEQTTSAS